MGYITYEATGIVDVPHGAVSWWRLQISPLDDQLMLLFSGGHWSCHKTWYVQSRHIFRGFLLTIYLTYTCYFHSHAASRRLCEHASTIQLALKKSTDIRKDVHIDACWSSDRKLSTPVYTCINRYLKSHRSQNSHIIWVNYNISLTWIVRPFGDDFPDMFRKL